MGVQVLPSQVHEPLSPKSPKSPELGILSGDEDDRKLKNKSKKQRQSRKHKEKDLEKEKDKENRPVDSQSWTVRETTQWQYPDEWRITDVCELQLLDDYINKKVRQLPHSNICLIIVNKSYFPGLKDPSKYSRDMPVCQCTILFNYKICGGGGGMGL